MIHLYRLAIIGILGFVFYQGRVSFQSLMDITGLIALVTLTVFSLSASYGIKRTLKVLITPFIPYKKDRHEPILKQIPVTLYFSSAIVFLIGAISTLQSDRPYSDYPAMLAISALPILYAMIFSEVIYRPVCRANFNRKH